MKWKIEDMMDHYEEREIELEDAAASVERVLARTMEKVNAEAGPHGQIRRSTLIAAVCAVTVLLTCAAGAALSWHGFALRENLSRSDRARIYEAIAYGVATEEIDPVGNVTIFDSAGTVVAEMTAAEYRQWTREQEAQQLERVQAGSDLLDISTMELAPQSITELTVTDGAIPDFMLGNGHMVLLKQEAGGWNLKAGDQVTVRVEAVNEPCNFTFGMVRDAAMVEEGVVYRSHLEDGELILHSEAQQPIWTFTIPEDGEYYFTMEYFSATADEFVNGTVTITAP